jgi:hypothetical protein
VILGLGTFCLSNHKWELGDGVIVPAVLQSIHLNVEASPDAKIVINDQGEIIVFNQKASKNDP